jgi:hypothetical protein
MQYRLRTLLIVLALGPPILVIAYVAAHDGEAAVMGVLTSLAFALVASLTWIFAPHPRLFVRAFAPRDKWREATQKCVRNRTFEPSMRMMAKIQYIVALWVGAFVAFGTWLS